MMRLALTGGIGTGKSTTLAMFARLGVPVLSADAIVHRLLAVPGVPYDAVASAFPDAVMQGRICRQMLGRLVFSDAPALARLEAILHPPVQRAEAQFLLACRAPLAVVEIPLLFETSGQTRFDAVVVTAASPDIKWRRVQQRAHMTREAFEAILARQWPDVKKLAHADFVVHTGLGQATAFRQVKTIVGCVHA